MNQIVSWYYYALMRNNEVKVGDYTVPQLRRAIDNRSFIRELSREFGIRLQGYPDKILRSILFRSDMVFDAMQSKHEEWVTAKRARLGDYLREVPEEIVRGYYDKGLQVTFKQEYKTVRDLSIGELPQLEEDQRIQDIITTYSYDFYNVLRFAKQRNLDPITGLKLGQLSYRNNRQALVRMWSDNPDLPEYVLVRACIANRLNPEAFIERVREQANRLIPLYPDFTPGEVMEVLASRPTDPEAFLQKAKKEVGRLILLFPEFSESTITDAVISHSSNPDSFLIKIRHETERLAVSFPEFPRSIIAAIITGHSNPEDTLAKLKDKLVVLTKKYPDIPRGILAHIASRNSDPDKFIKEAQVKIPHLQELFPDLSVADILHVVLRKTLNPEAFLQNYVKTFDRLKGLFPNLSLTTIKMAALGHPKDPEGYIKGVHERLSFLSTQHPDLPAMILKYAAFYYSDPKVFLEKFRQFLINTSLTHPHLSVTMVTRVFLANSKNPDGHLEIVEQRIAELSIKYPDLSNSIIEHVAINYSNPEQFLDDLQDKIYLLEKEFVGFSKSLMMQACVFYPKDTKKYLEGRRKSINELRNEYPEIPYYICLTAAINHTTDPRGYIDQVIVNTKRLKLTYPHLPDYVLSKAAIILNNPENYLDGVEVRTSELAVKYPSVPRNLVMRAVTHGPIKAEDFCKSYSPNRSILEDELDEDYKIDGPEAIEIIE